MAYVGTIKTQTGDYPIGSMLYGTCETAEDVRDKIVDLPSFDNLQAGITIHVRFANANTHNSPRLQVGSTKVKDINAGSGVKPSAAIWRKGSVLSFTYNNDVWTLNDAVNITATVDESSSAVPTAKAVNAAISAAVSSHAYPLSIMKSKQGTTSIALTANTEYKLTAGGSTYVFTTPKDTTYTAASSSTAVGTAAVTGTSTAYARADHVHNITKSTITSALGYTPVNKVVLFDYYDYMEKNPNSDYGQINAKETVYSNEVYFTDADYLEIFYGILNDGQWNEVHSVAVAHPRVGQTIDYLCAVKTNDETGTWPYQLQIGQFLIKQLSEGAEAIEINWGKYINFGKDKAAVPVSVGTQYTVKIYRVEGWVV